MHREICTLTLLSFPVVLSQSMCVQTYTHTYVPTDMPFILTLTLLSPSHHPSPLPQLTGHGRIGQCCHNPNERSQQSVRCGGSLQWSPERGTPHITATGRPKPGMTATQSRQTIMVNILVSITTTEASDEE